MKPLNSLVLIIFIFLSIQIMGLYVGSVLIDEMKKGDDALIQPITENPESVRSSIKLFGYVLVMTGVLFVLLKYGLDLIIRLMMYLAMLMGTLLTSLVIFGDSGLFLALALVLSAIVWKDKILVVNTTLLFTTAGIGALLGASLALKPALIFLLILSAYDFIAVFKTKHMVVLADKSQGKFPFMFLIPVGDRKMGLGTGDLVIPLTFTVSVLRDYTFANAMIAALGGLAGLIVLFLFILKKDHITLPALPPIAIGLILGFLVSLV